MILITDIKRYILKAKLLGYVFKKINKWIILHYMGNIEGSIHISKLNNLYTSIDTHDNQYFSLILTFANKNIVINELKHLGYNNNFIKVITQENKEYIISDLGNIIELKKRIFIKELNTEISIVDAYKKDRLNYNLFVGLALIRREMIFENSIFITNRLGKKIIITNNIENTLTWEYIKEDSIFKKDKYTIGLYSVNLLREKILICKISDSLDILKNSINKDYIDGIRIIEIN